MLVASIKSFNQVKIQSIVKTIIESIIEEILTYSELPPKVRKSIKSVLLKLADKYSNPTELIMRYKALPKEIDPDEDGEEPPPPPPPRKPKMLKLILKQLKTLTEKVDVGFAKQAEFNSYIEKKVDGVIKTQKAQVLAQKKTDKRLDALENKVDGVVETQKVLITTQKKTNEKVDEGTEKLERVIKLNKLKS
jgi:hypothetical protein